MKEFYYIKAEDNPYAEGDYTIPRRDEETRSCSYKLGKAWERPYIIEKRIIDSE